MRMPEEDKLKILERGRFLEEKGYQTSTTDYGVKYFNGEIKIMAYYERYENHCGLDIKFPGNYHFSVMWIAVVRDNAQTIHMELLDKILYHMDYLKEHFDEISTYEYCDESYLLLDEYFVRKREENPELFPVRGITYAESKAARKKLEEERKGCKLCIQGNKKR